MISGEITRFDVPSEIPVGDEISFKVDGNLYDPTRSPLAVWNWCLAAKGNGRKDYAFGAGTGTVIGPEIAPRLKLGIMPDVPVEVELRLYGNSSMWSTWDWSVWPG
ncbi:unnamed protein product [marine sediment metagenome]|uniref:Uncharacterized protein n=1 Tax=marine sediment metagenome TaxID=412755 RepID=X1RDM3_9ZZZZ